MRQGFGNERNEQAKRHVHFLGDGSFGGVSRLKAFRIYLNSESGDVMDEFGG